MSSEYNVYNEDQEDRVSPECNVYNEEQEDTVSCGYNVYNGDQEDTVSSYTMPKTKTRRIQCLVIQCLQWRPGGYSVLWIQFLKRRPG